MEGERGVCEREREEKNLRKLLLLRKKKKVFPGENIS